MKILLHGNSPRSNTGYGVQMALLATRLADDGHDIAISCTHGQQTGMGAWRTPTGKTIALYPTDDKSVGGHTIIHGHANHFFKGDPQAGWIIPLIDVPTLTPNTFLSNYQVAAWAPVDHVHVPPAVLQFFGASGATCICMSRHAETEFLRAGLDPTYIPLAVDTKAYKPTPYIAAGTEQVTAREYFGIPDNVFVVGMVAMNKGNVFDRKGFGEAMYAFGEFHRTHPASLLLIHSDKTGFSGMNLPQWARYAGIPEHALLFTDQYSYVHGFPVEQMAALYSAMDVLLSPSHGEGFCVPLIEAQACGTPVIASAATAQPELVGLGAGWLVKGQPIADPSQDSPAFLPFIHDVVDALEQAYAVEGDELSAMSAAARDKAAEYDADRVFDEYWRPFLASLVPPIPDADKPPMERVAVVVPAMRPEHVDPLAESLDAAYPDAQVALYFVCDPDNDELIKAVDATGWTPLISDRGSTFAQKANYAYQHTNEDFIFLCGEDVRFTPGWLDKPRELSTRYDVIGTNDAAAGEVKNRDVAAGRHADHWFTRRSYIDERGACLEGPGQFCPEAFFHWWTDKEVIELAKARGVFSPCLDSHVIHLHPGYDGDEAARKADPVYVKAVEWAERDGKKWRQRAPLIEQQRVVRR